MTVRPLSWACGHGTEMLLILKTIFDLTVPRYIQIWQSKKMSHNFVRGQSVAEICFSHWGYLTLNSLLAKFFFFHNITHICLIWDQLFENLRLLSSNKAQYSVLTVKISRFWAFDWQKVYTWHGYFLKSTHFLLPVHQGRYSRTSYDISYASY